MSRSENIPYLEAIDFDDNGNLKKDVNGGKPLVLMVQGSYCGHCNHAKPAYEQAAASGDGNAIFAMLQIDGGPTERAAAPFIQKNIGKFGVPAYLLYNAQGKFVKVYNGDRSAASLVAFSKE